MNFENCKYNHLDLSEKFLQMAEKFLLFAKDEKYIVDMGEFHVITHKCETIACHAGYAALALGKETNDFGRSKDYLAEFMGFEGDKELKRWAQLNPQIWGNSHGMDMFCDEQAFGASYFGGEITLKNIVQHYLDVAKRLMEIKS